MGPKRGKKLFKKNTPLTCRFGSAPSYIAVMEAGINLFFKKKQKKTIRYTVDIILKLIYTDVCDDLINGAHSVSLRPRNTAAFEKRLQRGESCCV